MLVYLDNCCYNRPYDNQEQLIVHLEAQSKMYIQSLIKAGVVELVSSFVLDYENACNPATENSRAIFDFLKNAKVYIGSDKSQNVIDEAKQIMQSGFKMKDACHIVCAKMAHADYLITTDKKMLKRKVDNLTLINPIDFVRLVEEADE